MSDKPLLTLCMIVKNEAHTLAKTLESAKSAIDRYCILDTGSTDGTQDLIRTVFEGVSGCVFEEPFVDFSTSRNRALDLAGEASEFILSLDADDVLVGGERLREYLTSVRNFEDGGYELTLRTSETFSFSTVRLFRASRRWRYRGAVHEILLPPGEGSYPAGMRRIDGVHIDHYPGPVGHEKTIARWTRDVALLRAELEANPGATRACFYLARTLMDIGTLEGMRMKNLEAFPIFERRSKMAGFKEEIFCSKLYMARCARRAGLPWNSCVGFWLAAHEEDPRRIEPLADLASEYSSRDEHASCVVFAARAMSLPAAHEGALFLENYDYFMAHLVGWHTYYLPDHTELGIAACRRAIALRPQNCAQDVKNLALHMQRVGKRKLSAAHLRALREVL